MSPPNQPRDDDAVLGNTLTSPPGATVLGGMEGVRQRFHNPIASQRIAALMEAQNYGLQGLELLIQGLQDQSPQVQKAAYLRLLNRPEPQALAAIAAYSPYPLFESLVTLQGHGGGISAVALHPQGRMLASSSRDRRVKVWDWEAGEEIFSFQVGAFVQALSFSAEDLQILTARRQDQILQAWHLKTGQAIRPPIGKSRSIASVTLSKDRHLISGSQNMIKIWDLQSGREVCSLKGHTSLVTAVAVSQDYQLIVSGSEDKTIRVWGVA